MPFGKVRFAFVGTLQCRRCWARLLRPLPSSVKLLRLHLKQKRPLGRALDKDEGRSFDMVAGEMLCVQIGVYVRVRQGEEK
jgi:hypothetical protein